MAATGDTNAEFWKSDAAVQHWLTDVDERERERLPQWQLMAELLPFAEQEAFTFLDLGAGTGGAARIVLARYPRSSAILADFSPQMMTEAASVMRRFEGRWEYVELDLMAGAWPASIPSAVDAVVTSQCVHHLPDERKRSLFVEIRERLVPGGWYVNLDPVSAVDPLVEAAWQRANDSADPEAAGQRDHRTSEEQARHENHVRYIAPLDRQLDFLRSAGFEAVDVYWKQLDYVIFAGSRPSSSGPLVIDDEDVARGTGRHVSRPEP